MRHFLAAAFLLVLPCLSPALHAGDAATDWQAIQAMDGTAPAGNWSTREEARDAAVAFLTQQEATLRDFLASHPADPHAMDVELRLAHLLATRGDLQQDAGGRRAAEAIFTKLERDPALASRRADVAFARISLFMQRLDTEGADARAELLSKARKFAAAYPDDRRVAALLAEVATLYQGEPRLAISLLEQARSKANTEELRHRIDDDLKRLGLLGKPLEMKWLSVLQQPVDLEAMRGKVVLIYFFAKFSAPSVIELDWVRQLALQQPLGQVAVLGICLDPDPVQVPAFLSDHNIGWPVYCDGAGWQGGLVRSLGINAIPALWVVDREGILRSLDARQNAEALIQRLLGGHIY